MATATLRLSLTRPVPMRILALAMRIETAYWMREFTPLIGELTDLQKEVSELVKRCQILAERVERCDNRVLDILEQIRPMINDIYNLCGDPDCDGSCMVCCDGEYLGEEESYEKYCRRGKR